MESRVSQVAKVARVSQARATRGALNSRGTHALGFTFSRNKGFTFITDVFRKLRLSDMQAKPHLGFTFIEVLITITIISVLAAIGVTNFRGTQKQVRDTERKNDIKQYQLALENYASGNNSLYPSQTAGAGASAKDALCPNLGIYIAGCPEDPTNSGDPTFAYLYQSDGSGSGTPTALSWVLWAKFERNPNYWVVCSNGKSGEKAQQGFGVSGGECPL